MTAENKRSFEEKQIRTDVIAGNEHMWGILRAHAQLNVEDKQGRVQHSTVLPKGTSHSTGRLGHGKRIYGLRRNQWKTEVDEANSCLHMNPIQLSNIQYHSMGEAFLKASVCVEMLGKRVQSCACHAVGISYLHDKRSLSKYSSLMHMLHQAAKGLFRPKQNTINLPSTCCMFHSPLIRMSR